MNRRQFLSSTAAVASSVASAAWVRAARVRAASRPTTTRKAATTVPDNVIWHDVRDWGVEGRGFADTEDYFDRLPARAKSIVRPEVWNLSKDTSGMSARFTTDADAIYIRYTLTKSDLALTHMPATGVSGVDLYIREANSWRWRGTAFPHAQQVTEVLVDGLAPSQRSCLINLPLYNGIKSLEIGVPKNAAFTPTPPRKEKPICIYGTSITQGACASRPGMSFMNILDRRLDRPILNFGFSGNGRLEYEVARFLAELDPAIFILDCLANIGSDAVAQRTVPLVKILREKHATTPVLLLDERPSSRKPLAEKTAALRKAHEELVASGDQNIHYRAGDDLLGADGEATVDGSHPSDLGMMRYADALEPTIRKLIDPS